MSTTNPDNILMDAAKTVTATFVSDAPQGTLRFTWGDGSGEPEVGSSADFVIRNSNGDVVATSSQYQSGGWSGIDDFALPPLVLHLLAPNMRAVQVTTDLSGFWERHYPAIRKELMRRYPRHEWPENPSTASPPAGGGTCRRHRQ